MLEICKSCNSEVSQNYCPKCGHPKILKRIDRLYIFQEIRNVLDFEKGFLFTVRELTFNPGKSIIVYLNENRNRLVKPLVFLIVTSLIYTVLNNFLHFEDDYINYSNNKESATLAIFKWIQGNYGYANIIMAIFIGLWLKVFFRKYPFNFFEILILLCFIMGVSMLIYSAFGLVQGLTQLNIMPVAVIMGFIYATYAAGQFFDKRKLTSYGKAFIAYLLGMVTYFMAAFVIGTIIDLIIQK